ncbi:MAG: hypothetical protein LKK08_05590 [Bacteroidales bacterium]|nr:hypothetical protein [Bacteroidales bacterium]MCI2145701.1 hypothetical protein [Bacteroidales bacterium]
MKSFRFLLFSIMLAASVPVFGQKAVMLSGDTRNPQRDTIDVSDYASLPSTISKDSILIGDQIQWTMPFTLKKGERYAFQDFEDDKLTPFLEKVGPFRVDTLKAKKGDTEMHLEGKLTITSFDSGTVVLPPVAILFVRNDGTADTAFFKAPDLEVKTIPIDTATFKPFDIKGQIPYPVTFREMVPWILLFLLFAALVWLIVRVISTRTKGETFFGKPKVVEPPHITALRSLDRIKSRKLWQNGKQKEFYTEVTEALRTYISARYGISAMEMTSKEMLDLLAKEEVQPELYNEMKDLFNMADFVKFAKYEADTAANEEVIPAAVKFVNETYMQELEKEREAEESKKAREEESKGAQKEESAAGGAKGSSAGNEPEVHDNKS